MADRTDLTAREVAAGIAPSATVTVPTVLAIAHVITWSDAAGLLAAALFLATPRPWSPR